MIPGSYSKLCIYDLKTMTFEGFGRLKLKINRISFALNN
jgi:hypothetical protein